jgi:parallel beta-helix repeat protein
MPGGGEVGYTVGPQSTPVLAPVSTPAGKVVYVSRAATAPLPVGTYNSIASAVSALSATGGTILLKDSTYLGPVTINGLTKPTLIKPAPGVQSQVTCSNPLTGWQPYSGSIYRVTSSAKISAVFLNGAFLPQARYPTSGFLSVAPTPTPIPGVVPAPTPNTTTIAMQPADVAVLPSTDLTNATVVLRNIDYRSGSIVVGSFVSGADELVANLTPPQKSACSNSNCAFTYPVGAGWGYYLENKTWMMTQPGSWVYDAPSSTLYVWMPDSSNPANSQSLSAASDASNCLNVSNSPGLILQGLQVTNSGSNGIYITNSPNIRLNQVGVSNVVQAGVIADAPGPFLMDSSQLNNIGENGLSLYVDTTDTSPSIIEGNQITNIGTAPGTGLYASGISLSFYLGSPQAITQIRNNSFNNIAYQAIQAAYNVNIQGNTVSNFCLILDDCGGIYVTGRALSPGFVTNISITGNIVSNATAYVEGKPASRGPYAAAGIYLDDYTHGAVVKNNIVTNADMGIMAHNYHDNQLSGNILSAKIPLNAQEDSLRKTLDSSTNLWYYVLADGSTTAVGNGSVVPANAIPSMGGNIFTDNYFIADSLGSSKVVNAISNQIPTGSSESVKIARAAAAFSGNGNSFANLLGPIQLMMEGLNLGVEDLVTNKMDLAPQTLASRSSLIPPLQTVTSGAPLYTFSSTNDGGFTSYTSVGTVTEAIETCPLATISGTCLSISSSAATTNPLAIKPFGFALQVNQVYLVSVQMMSGTSSTVAITPQVTRNGPTYESLDSTGQTFGFYATPMGWTTYQFYFDASVDVASLDARLDLFFPPNSNVILGGLEITPVTTSPTVSTSFSQTLVNTQDVPLTVSCSDVGSSCLNWKNLSGQVLNFPLELPPRAVLPIWH